VYYTDGNGIDQVEAFRVLGEHRREDARDNIENLPVEFSALLSISISP
jgi:hypothetical protein